ncbi:MAG: DUF1727 domain-containing protein [Candidatus Dormibacteria bacterium]
MAGPDLRLMAAVGASRAVGATSRKLRLGGGTTLPGDFARALDPGVLRKLASSVRAGVVLVTGTNGKTTTSALLRTLVQGSGLRVGGNPSGSNLLYGLTAAALKWADVRGRVDLDWLVLEVDELSAPQAVAEVCPRGLVILNAFRDQLDRSFEIDQVAARLQEAVLGLSPGAFWVGNADDPRVASFESRGTAAGVTRTLFGLNDPGIGHTMLPAVVDSRSCPRCRAELEFSLVYYAHCGLYHCPQCGFSRPEPQVGAETVQMKGLDGLDMDVVGQAGWRAAVSVPLGGLYNAANVAAAMAAATAMGVDPALANTSLAQFQPSFGRSQLATWRGARFRLMLAKNPAGLDENLTAVLALDKSPVIAIALNDGVADGRDISWIWDVDMERLGTTPRLSFVVSGTRASELALRLGYAGVSSDRISVRPLPAEALSELAGRALPGVPVPCLLTYTAMLAWHSLLVRSGSGTPFFQAT